MTALGLLFRKEFKTHKTCCFLQSLELETLCPAYQKFYKCSPGDESTKFYSSGLKMYLKERGSFCSRFLLPTQDPPPLCSLGNGRKKQKPMTGLCKVELVLAQPARIFPERASQNIGSRFQTSEFATELPLALDSDFGPNHTIQGHPVEESILYKMAKIPKICPAGEIQHLSHFFLSLQTLSPD